jgi:sarcosine oxidase, subunit beta
VAGESAEVVIVGGGAIGAATAFHLTALGVSDVVLLERDTLASGSTSKSAGGIRAQFADELNIRIALRSIAEFDRFEELTGTAIDYRHAGYVFLLDQEDDARRFRAALTLQARLGVPSRELTLDELAELLPPVETAGLVAATYCPLDGIATPEAAVAGWADAARRRGAQVRQGEAVVAIERAGDRIVAVETERGRIATDTVVCAAGVWSRDIAALAGLDLPVRGEPRWTHYTPERDGLPDVVPLTVDFTTGFYFHGEGPGVAFGGREQTLEELAEHAATRLPVLAELPIASSWWGYYEMSPDHNAIVGEAGDPSRFLYATGFSGHGFQQAPAVGEHLAELVVGSRPTLDLSPFSLDRFARGEAREEAFVI